MPEAPPAKPAATLASRMEDVVFTGGASIAGAAVMAVFAHGNGASMLFGGVSMFGFGVMRGYMGYRREVQQHGQQAAQRQQKQEAYLSNKRTDLERACKQQREALLRLDPDPEELVRRAEGVDVRLFERTLGEPDFLSLRLGLGARPFCLKLKTPAVDRAEKDPLIQQTAQLAAEYSQVQGVPICASFKDLGAGGIAGPRPQVLETTRALLMQLATHHSPEDVKIVLLHPPEEDWSWIRWLPHVWNDDRTGRFIASDNQTATALLEQLNDVLKRRALRSEGDSEKKSVELPIFVFVFASGSLVKDSPVPELIQRNGGRLGALGLFFGETAKELPKACRTVVEASPGKCQVLVTHPEPAEFPFESDIASVVTAARLARALCPLKVQAAGSGADIPTRASMLELAGVDRIEEFDVLQRWQQNVPYKSMAVPVGLQAGGKTLELNLHETGHGPHGLVAGTTGSGKTAFLSTFLGLLAVQFHPHEVAFVCVDYKGGDLFRGLEELPHLVGTLTNLEKSEVWRCLRALQAENERRMRLFAQASKATGVAINKIDEYQELQRQGRVPEPLPKLLIVCDEFAELSKQEPEFIGRLVSIARVGRSLGVHLILATQQPAGIIGDQIESNTRFRMAFKFNKEEDSKAVIKRPEAASIRQSGRGYFQLGENEIFELFQSAWGGAAYSAVKKQVDAPEVLEILPTGARRRLTEKPKTGDKGGGGKARTQLQEMSAHIARTAEKHGIARLPGPWLPPLPAKLLLEDVHPSDGWNGTSWSPTQRWLQPVIGLVDDPSRSFQGPLQLDLAAEGHVACFGRPGAGNTTLLQTILVSLARQHSPEDLHFYIMDFAGRAFTRLRRLPHVGDVVVAEDQERSQRMLRFLLRQMQRRKETLAEAGVSTLASYRSSGKGKLPAIVLILDNYVKFSKEMSDSEDLLATIVQEGGNLGIYVVLSASSPSSLKPKTGGNISTAISLQLADRTEYTLAVGRSEGVEPAAVVGRGLVKAKPPLEFQTALAFAGSTDVDRAEALDALMEAMATSWTGTLPPPVPVVPAQVTLDTLIAEPSMDKWGPATAVPIGIDMEDVLPFRLAPADGPHFFVSGTMQSGKSTFLTSWVLSLAAHMSPAALDITLVDFREGLLQPLTRLPHVRQFADTDETFGQALARLREMSETRRAAVKAARMEAGGVLDEAAWAASQPTALLIIDDFEGMRSLASALNQEDLISLVKVSRGPGIHVILAGSVDDMGSNTYDGVFKAIASYKSGMLIGTREDNGVFNNVRIPMQSEVLRGQGFFVQRGTSRARIQLAVPGSEPKSLLEWLDRLAANPAAAR